MEEVDALVQPIFTDCLDKIVGSAAGGKIKEEGNRKVKALLNIFSKHAIEVLVDLLRDIL